jgi:putative alpha-1,2-mannosidase
VAPDADTIAEGYALQRFEGLNNEPDMEAPWAYHYVGRPDRTTEVVHAVVNNQFATGRGGLPGNDDSGGLSSWYVWASLGLFPVAGQQLVFVNAPSFPHARITVPGGAFTIETAGFVEPERDGPVQYVQSVRLDDQPLERSWITLAELHRGGRLHIELGHEPSAWGTTLRPPSVSVATAGVPSTTGARLRERSHP